MIPQEQAYAAPEGRSLLFEPGQGRQKGAYENGRFVPDVLKKESLSASCPAVLAHLFKHRDCLTYGLGSPLTDAKSVAIWADHCLA